MSTFFDDLIKGSAEEVKKLESSQEYVSLIARKNDLQTKKNTIIDEIYEYRKFPDKIDNLTKAKTIIDDAIKEVDDKISSMRTGLIDGAGLGFVLRSLKSESDPFEEFLNPSPKPAKNGSVTIKGSSHKINNINTGTKI